MTHQNKNVEASLLYQVKSAPFATVDTLALRSTIETLGVSVQDMQVDSDAYALLICDQIEILVAGCNLPFTMDHFRGVSRPAGTDCYAEVLSALARHKSSLTVLVLDREDRKDTMAPDELDALKQQICQETIDFLMATTAPDLVFWSNQDKLLTIAEAEAEIDGVPTIDSAPKGDAAVASTDWSEAAITPARPKRPSRPQRPQALSARPSIMPPLQGGDIFLDNPPIYKDWDAIKTARPRRTHCAPSTTKRPKHRWSEPQLSPEVMTWFEGTDTPAELKPVSSDLSALRNFMALDTSKDVKRIADTATGRASLYVMSATIGVFALPLGASMLTYNALSGGSFRATSHMMALTGLGLALSSLGLPSPAAALGF